MMPDKHEQQLSSLRYQPQQTHHFRPTPVVASPEQQQQQLQRFAANISQQQPPPSLVVSQSVANMAMPPPNPKPSIKAMNQSAATYISSLAFLNTEPPPVQYDVETIVRRCDQPLDGDVHEERKIRRDYAASEADAALIAQRRSQQRVIKLRQKRQRVRIRGTFRSMIPIVDSMCRNVENYDFDNTDLFPLGAFTRLPTDHRLYK